MRLLFLKMPITLSLKNFRCWENQTFTFQDRGIILLSGISGKGKSTILNAILYIITGNMKNIVTVGKDKLEVTLEIDDMIITRSKQPTRFFVKKNNIIYEEDEAQILINNLFGGDFKHTSYIDQDNINSFVYLSPESKMTFLRNLLLNSEKIDLLKDNIKKNLELSKKEVIQEDSKLSTFKSFLPQIFEYKIQKRLITLSNYEETLKTQQQNIEICIKNKIKLLSKLELLEKDYKKYIQFSILSSKQNDIQKELQSFLSIEIIQQQITDLEEMKKNIEEIEKIKELNKLKQEIQSFQPNEYKKIKSFEKFIELEKSILLLEEKIGEDKEEKLKSQLDTILLQIEKIKIGNVYECPQCLSHLLLQNEKLIKTENEISIINSSSIIIFQKKIEEIQKELTLISHHTKEYNKLFDEFESLSITLESSEIKKKLEQYKKEERSYTLLQTKISQLEIIIKDKNINIEETKSLYEIIEEITKLKEILKRYKFLKSEIIEIEIINDPSPTLKETKDKIKDFEEKIETYSTHISKLKEWNKNRELSISIKSAKDAKEYYMEEVKCYEKLQHYVKEAETKSIIDFIDSLNQHAQLYIEDFFKDEDIQVQLVTNKELKSGKDKIGLFFKVFYKKMEGDIDFLSGGQRDRINLAFTLALSELVDNRILLLDECISSLDSETTDTVIETLKEKYKGKLIICVSHQVNTGMFDEVILV